VAGDGQTKLNAVINGQADLLLGYVMDQSMKIKDATGKDVYPIKFADYGINMVSSGIIANTDYVKANADSSSASWRRRRRRSRPPKRTQGCGAVDPRRQPEGRQDRYADPGFRTDDPALPHAGNQNKTAVQVTDQNMTDTST